ncbi:MAG: AraC family transcriptional regulator [Oscillospiraceae bacterium]
MDRFAKIKEALEYIDGHLDEGMTLEMLADRFHFSPYYFHRMFSVIVGKPVATHIRDRRLMRACVQLSAADRSVLEIGLDSGYNSAQAFSRAFKGVFGLPPVEYRRQGYTPVVVTVDEMIMKFTNRLRGGVYLNPNIIKRSELIVAGVSGDGFQTAEVWDAFEKLHKEKPLANRESDNGYEVRLHDGSTATVHVGYLVSGDEVDPAYEVIKLPATQYASFDVYVAKGYDSENSAMNEWLATNSQGYSERLLGDVHFCVEYYDERFNGSEAGSIVEIWIPIEKK